MYNLCRWLKEEGSSLYEDEDEDNKSIDMYDDGSTIASAGIRTSGYASGICGWDRADSGESISEKIEKIREEIDQLRDENNYFKARIIILEEEIEKLKNK